MPVYTYRCRACGDTTDHLAAVGKAPEQVVCEHCGSTVTHRIIASVAYHASEAAKTARLDPRYEKMVDHAMTKSASADEHRLLRKMKPFPDRK
ncbi:MAG: zinc ribbon domain-containing protein [Pseudomonadales bacterium]